MCANYDISGMAAHVEPVDPATMVVIIKPMQIRTFMLQIQYL